MLGTREQAGNRPHHQEHDDRSPGGEWPVPVLQIPSSLDRAIGEHRKYEDQSQPAHYLLPFPEFEVVATTDRRNRSKADLRNWRLVRRNPVRGHDQRTVPMLSDNVHGEQHAVERWRQANRDDALSTDKEPPFDPPVADGSAKEELAWTAGTLENELGLRVDLDDAIA
ncbi:hypothetical protein [Sphingomonas glaciei]|uniref:Uncharacterized protein n=1 Tax=Sphingomonas glaciei TaxID=2938948 RepID=A0ABY5MX45_9SPHN|nr:hypothetical protein [Sphingomonas glaciei]UUR09020.1 hypothetical protein M1K48_05210 [Sphingomonas glaciei]